MGFETLKCQRDGTWSAEYPTCRACGVNTFKSSTNANDGCKACPNYEGTGGKTAQSVCVCDAGYSRNDGTCEPCAAHTFKASTGNGPCDSCAPGQIAVTEGSTFCTPRFCDALPSVEFGSLTSSNRNFYPSIATVKCQTGFALTSSADIGCQTDGSWPTPSSCEAICGDGESFWFEKCELTKV